MHFIKQLFFIIFLSVICIDLVSQEGGCANSLQEAQKLFNQGMIDQIDEILQPCIESGFTRNQRAEAYKLIILASLLDGDQLQAENTMIEFLKKNPEYEIMPNDPVEFVYLFESYRTLSVFSLGLKIGTNFTNPVIKEPWNSGDIGRTVSSDKTGAGYQVGFSVNRYIARRLFVNIEFNYFSNSYKFVDEYGLENFINDPDYEIETFKETLKRYDIPLSIGYEFESIWFNYYIRTGVSYCHLSKATSTPTKELVYSSDIINGATKSIIDFREDQLFFYHVGAGLKYKIPRGFLIFDIRYHMGMNLINIPEKRFDFVNMFGQEFKYIDDDFKVNSLTISVGYYFSFYQPKKNQK